MAYEFNFEHHNISGNLLLEGKPRRSFISGK